MARLVLLGYFFASMVIYGIIQRIQPQNASDFCPSYLGFLALAPLIVFTFVGFEVSCSATTCSWRINALLRAALGSSCVNY